MAGLVAVIYGIVAYGVTLVGAPLSHRFHRQSHRSEVDRFRERLDRCSRA